MLLCKTSVNFPPRNESLSFFFENINSCLACCEFLLKNHTTVCAVLHMPSRGGTIKKSQWYHQQRWNSSSFHWSMKRHFIGESLEVTYGYDWLEIFAAHKSCHFSKETAPQSSHLIYCSVYMRPIWNLHEFALSVMGDCWSLEENHETR